MRPGSTRSGACEKYREFGRFGSLVNSGTSLQDDFGHALGRTGGSGGLQDHELAAGELRRDPARCGLDVGEVSVVIALEGRGDRDDVRIGLGGLGLRRELALGDDSRDDRLETLLDERNRAGVDRINIRLLDVHADHSLACLREDSGRRQTDVTEADHAHGIEGDVRAHRGFSWEWGQGRNGRARPTVTVAVAEVVGCGLVVTYTTWSGHTLEMFDVSPPSPSGLCEHSRGERRLGSGFRTVPEEPCPSLDDSLATDG